MLVFSSAVADIATNQLTDEADEGDLGADPLTILLAGEERAALEFDSGAYTNLSRDGFIRSNRSIY